MVYLYNTDLEFVGKIEESEFTYSKKAGKEGGGKVVHAELLPKDAFYIIIERGGVKQGESVEYITSGYISQLIEEKAGYSFQYKTLEGLLKHHFLPKHWGYQYEKDPADIVLDMMFGFRPIYKTSKSDLGAITTGNQTVLECHNIAFENIEGSELTLSFDQTKRDQENVYYYCTSGYITFQFDLGELRPIREFSYRGYYAQEPEWYLFYPLRWIRWSAQEGEKTFIRWAIMDSDMPLTAGSSELQELHNRKTRLDWGYGKDKTSQMGYPLYNCNKRYVIIRIYLEYHNPDYASDFNTEEIFLDANKYRKVKRTVRGFTPILHGFEILNRCPLSPFSTARISSDCLPTITSDGTNNNPDWKKNLTEKSSSAGGTIVVIGSGANSKRYSPREEGNVGALSGVSFAEALEKIQKACEVNITFDLKRYGSMKNAQLFVSLFGKNQYNPFSNPPTSLWAYDRRFDPSAILRSPDTRCPLLANFTLQTRKQEMELPFLIDAKGAGSNEIDAVRLVAYIQYVEVEGALKREAFVYGADGIDFSRNSVWQYMKTKPVTSAFIDNVKLQPYKEVRLEFNDAKTPDVLIWRIYNYLVEQEKELKDATFEAGVTQNVRLYDYVRVAHAKSGKVYDVVIKEEKITNKNGHITKTVGLSGGLYNPFDSFFAKKQELPIITEPTVPSDIKISSCGSRVRFEWTAQGVWDGFKIEIARLDGVIREKYQQDNWYSNNTVRDGKIGGGYAYRTYYTKNSYLELTTLEVDTIYSFEIVSLYESKQSKYSGYYYFKMESSSLHIRHVNSLEEKGEDGDVIYFYDKNLWTQYNLMSDSEKERHIIGRLQKLTCHSLYAFNSIEQFRTYTVNDAEVGVNSYGGHPRLPVPYLNPPICNSWDPDFYDEARQVYGEYYVWRSGKWREKRLEVPRAPLLFLNMSKKNVYIAKSLTLTRHFKVQWESFCFYIREYQRTRMEFDKLLAYCNFGTPYTPEYEAYGYGDGARHEGMAVEEDKRGRSGHVHAIRRSSREIGEAVQLFPLSIIPPEQNGGSSGGDSGGGSGGGGGSNPSDPKPKPPRQDQDIFNPVPPGMGGGGDLLTGESSSGNSGSSGGSSGGSGGDGGGRVIPPGGLPREPQFGYFSDIVYNTSENIAESIVTQGATYGGFDDGHLPPIRPVWSAGGGGYQPPPPAPPTNPPKPPGSGHPGYDDGKKPEPGKPGYTPGDYFGPNLPPTSPGTDKTAEYGSEDPSGDQWSRLKTVRDSLSYYHGEIFKALQSTCEDESILTRLIKGRYDGSALRDISKNSDVWCRFPGFTREEEVSSGVSSSTGRQEYYLKDALHFTYCDLDNGGAEDIKLPFGPRQLSFQFSYSWLKDFRIPTYSLWKINSIRDAFVDTQTTEQGKNVMGSKTFTFACWVRLESASDGVCLWDVSGFCTGFIQDGALHIGHKEVKRDTFVPRIWDIPYWRFDWDKRVEDITLSLVPFYRVPANYGGYTHVMVECEVLKETINTPTVDTSMNVHGPYIRYTITHTIYIDFKKVPTSEFIDGKNSHYFRYKNSPLTDDQAEENIKAKIYYYKDENTDSPLPGQIRRYLKEELKNSIYLENTPGFSIASFTPKKLTNYKFKKPIREQYSYRPEHDQTDYSWTHYDFYITHILIFSGRLTRKEKAYLKEYGSYPTVEKGEVKHAGGSTYKETAQYKDGGYLGIVSSKVAQESPQVRTMKSGDGYISASRGDFFLMSVDIGDFHAGAIYKWTGSRWAELKPIVKYPREAKDAFNDLKYLPRIVQQGAYQEFSAHSLSVSTGFVSQAAMLDEVTVVSNLSVVDLPKKDPKVKGAVYIDGGVLKVSEGES